MSEIRADLPLRDVLSLLVRATHQGILGRGVDAEWQQAFVAELTRRAAASDAETVVADFIRVIHECPEAQERMTRRPGERSLRDFVQPALALRPSPVSVIAAGCAPRLAGMLRRAALRRWAGPFDWMTIPPEAVRDSLADGVLALVQPRHFEAIPAHARPPGSAGHFARHARFTQLYGETMFHGADPTTEAGHAAIERAALRLRDALRGLHAKLLLQLVEEGPGTLNTWAETGEMLDRFARGAALVTVAMVPGPPEGPFPEMELAESRGPHRLLRCRTLSGGEALGFADLLDEAVILRGALSTAAQE